MDENSVISKLKRMVADWLPMTQETVIDSRNQPLSVLPGMTADSYHAAITLAEQGDTEQLFTFYRDALTADSHLQSVIATRFLAVIGEDVNFQAVDPKNKDDVRAKDEIQAAVERLPDFMGVCRDLLWGHIWPLSMVERTYKQSSEPGLRYDWRDLVAVPDHLFRWTNGVLEVAEVSSSTHSKTGKYFQPEPSRYIIHRGHLLRTPDCWGGPMRSLVWWFFLGLMDRDWWVRFLDKYGTPFMVGKFDKTDDRSRQILERAFRLSTKIGGVVVSTGTQIELLKASTGDSAAAYQAFHDVCNREKSKAVLGQTLSSDSQSTGLNSGNAALHSEVRGDIRQYDAKKLAQTLRQQLFAPWLRLNGFTGRPPNIIFGPEDTEETTTTAEVLSSLKTAGLRLADAGLPTLSRRVGLPIERDSATPGAPGQPDPAVKRLAAPLPLVRDPSAAAESISRSAAATISRTFGGTLAPVREILLSASDPDQAFNQLQAAFSDWSPSKVAETVESALAAGAWNGSER